MQFLYPCGILLYTFCGTFCVPVQFVKLSLEHFICGNPEQPDTWTVTILFRTQQHNHSVSGLSEHRCRTANSCYFRLVIMTNMFSVQLLYTLHKFNETGLECLEEIIMAILVLIPSYFIISVNIKEQLVCIIEAKVTIIHV